MNCQETRTLLPEYQEGALTEARRRAAESHLSGCASCRTALAEARNLDAFLRGAVRVPEPPADFWARQETRALTEASRSRPSGRATPPFLWFVGMGVAAAILIAIGVYVIFGSSSAPANNDLTQGSPASPAPKAVKAAPPPREVAPERRPENPPPRDPDPRLFSFREPSSQNPSPAAEPQPERLRPAVTLPAPEGVATTLLPGDPDHLDRLTNENIEVGLADSSSDRVLGLIKAADARLNELKAALNAKKESIAVDLAQAYAMIFRDGIGFVLQDRDEDLQDLAIARAAAKTYAGWNVKTLSGLESGTEGNVRSAIHDALLAAREIAGR